MAVLFDWNRTAATAFDKQLLIAQGAASGEDVAARMVGKQVEEKKNKKTKTKAASSSSSSSAGDPSTSASSTSATATAFFSPSASVSSATVSFPTTTKGRRIKRKHDKGSGSVFQYTSFHLLIRAQSCLSQKKSLLALKSFCVKIAKIMDVNYKQAVLRRS